MGACAWAVVSPNQQISSQLAAVPSFVAFMPQRYSLSDIYSNVVHWVTHYENIPPFLLLHDHGIAVHRHATARRGNALSRG